MLLSRTSGLGGVRAGSVIMNGGVATRVIVMLSAYNHEPGNVVYRLRR